MKKSFTYTQDPRHGWLSVSLNELVQLKIEKEISPYSYMNTTRVFLEEDRDMRIFMDKAKLVGWEVSVEQSHVDKTNIRNLKSYDAESIAYADAINQFQKTKKGNISILLFNKDKQDYSTPATVIGMDEKKFIIEANGRKMVASDNLLLKSTKFVGISEELELQKKKMKLKSKF